MRSIFGNNCAKGCLIYVVVLIALLVVAAMGLDGLRARFGGAQVQGIQPPEYTIQSTGTSPSSPTDGDLASSPAESAAGGGGGGGGIPTPTIGSVPPPPVSSPVPVGTPAPTEAQGGTITGETGTPFYVIQSGDTLWAISRRFGVDLDELRTLNNLTDDIIYPGQVLYLPIPDSSPAAPTTEPGTPNTGASGEEGDPGSMPSMPNTGIVKKP